MSRLVCLAYFEFFLSVLTLGMLDTVRFAPQEENPNYTQADNPLVAIKRILLARNCEMKNTRWQLANVPAVGVL